AARGSVFGRFTHDLRQKAVPQFARRQHREKSQRTYSISTCESGDLLPQNVVTQGTRGKRCQPAAGRCEIFAIERPDRGSEQLSVAGAHLPIAKCKGDCSVRILCGPDLPAVGAICRSSNPALRCIWIKVEPAVERRRE